MTSYVRAENALLMIKTHLMANNMHKIDIDYVEYLWQIFTKNMPRREE